ncbi:MAG: glycosyltransferase family 1 protein [Planctomycetota bacterium]
MTRVGINCLILREPYTGVAYSIFRMVEALAREDRDRSYCALVPRTFSREFPQEVEVRKSILVGGGSASARVMYEQLVFPFTSHKLRADYFHFPAWVAPRMLKVPYVLTVHDVIPFLYPAFCRKATVKHFKSMMPGSVEKSRAVIVPSEAVKKELLNITRNCPEEKVHVVPFAPVHPPAQVRGHEAKKILEKKYYINFPFFLTVGNIEPRKNLPTLLKAFFAARARKGFPHKLVIIGRTSRGFKGVDDVLYTHGMEEMVERPGYVDEVDLPLFYSCCTAFCFPSLAEGFGLPLLEALQEGARCLLSDIPVFRELAGKAAQFLPAYDLTAWREAIENAAEKGQGDAVARKMWHDQAAKFTWKKTAQGITEVYKNVEQELGLV